MKNVLKHFLLWAKVEYFIDVYEKIKIQKNKPLGFLSL